MKNQLQLKTIKYLLINQGTKIFLLLAICWSGFANGQNIPLEGNGESSSLAFDFMVWDDAVFYTNFPESYTLDSVSKIGGDADFVLNIDTTNGLIYSGEITGMGGVLIEASFTKNQNQQVTSVSNVYTQGNNIAYASSGIFNSYTQDSVVINKIITGTDFIETLYFNDAGKISNRKQYQENFSNEYSLYHYAESGILDSIVTTDDNQEILSKMIFTFNESQEVITSVELYYDYGDGLVYDGKQIFHWTKDMLTSSNSISKLKNQVNIYPNPANTILNISSPNYTGIVEFYNLSGSLVKTVEMYNSEITVDMSNFAKGYYFVKLNNGSTQKLIVR